MSKVGALICGASRRRSTSRSQSRPVARVASGGRGSAEFEQLAADFLGARITTIEAADKARQHGFDIGQDAGGEFGQHFRRHGVRPAVALDERGGAGDQHQFADFFRGAGGDGERQLRAERPAAERGVGLQAGGDVVGGVVKVADQRRGAITRQVENCAI
jgi:hypothetical protein